METHIIVVGKMSTYFHFKERLELLDHKEKVQRKKKKRKKTTTHKTLSSKRDGMFCYGNLISYCNWKHGAAIWASMFAVSYKQTSLDKTLTF